MIHGIEGFTAIIIVSGKSQEIREATTRVLRRGITVYKGRGGLTDVEQDILFCVVTRLEVGNVKNLAKK